MKAWNSARCRVPFSMPRDAAEELVMSTNGSTAGELTLTKLAQRVRDAATASDKAHRTFLEARDADQRATVALHECEADLMMAVRGCDKIGRLVYPRDEALTGA